jgi:anthranilate phosphoribosyltransferase
MVGVFRPEHLKLYGEILKRGGRRRWLVAYGQDAVAGSAIGEISVTGANEFAAGLGKREIPGKWPVARIEGALAQITVKSAKESAARLAAILEGKEQGLGRALLLANAAAAVCVQGKIRDYTEALETCERAIDAGLAQKKLRDWKEWSRKMKK